MKKTFCLLITALLLLLTACTGSGDSAYDNAFDEMNPTPVPTENSGEVTELTGELTLTSATPPEYTFLKFYGDLFMEKHPGVTIHYNMPETREEVAAFADQMLLSFYSDTGGDVYDMLEQDYQKIARSGMFMDMYYLMNEDESFDPNAYYTNIWEAMEVDGKLYTMPSGFCYDIVQLNLEATEGIGFEPKLGDSIDYIELKKLYLEAVDKGLLVPDANIITGLNPAYLDSIETPNRFMDISSITSNFDSDDFFRYYEETRENDLFTSKYPLSIAGNLDETSFGTLTTSQYATWQAGQLPMENVQSLNKTIPLKLDSSTGNHIFRRGSSMAIHSLSKYQQLPWEFVKFVIEEKDLRTALDIDTKAWDMMSQFPINKNNCRKIMEITSSPESADYIDSLNSQLDTQVLDFGLVTFVDELGNMSAEGVGKFMQEKADLYFSEW